MCAPQHALERPARPSKPNATGTTQPDPKRPPRLNTTNSRRSPSTEQSASRERKGPNEQRSGDAATHNPGGVVKLGVEGITARGDNCQQTANSRPDRRKRRTAKGKRAAGRRHPQNNNMGWRTARAQEAGPFVLARTKSLRTAHAREAGLVELGQQPAQPQPQPNPRSETQTPDTRAAKTAANQQNKPSIEPARTPRTKTKTRQRGGDQDTNNPNQAPAHQAQQSRLATHQHSEPNQGGDAPAQHA